MLISYNNNTSFRKRLIKKAVSILKTKNYFLSIFNLLKKELTYKPGLPQGQEIRKSQENLRKMTKVRKFDKFKKISDFVSLNLPKSLYSKAFEW